MIRFWLCSAGAPRRVVVAYIQHLGVYDSEATRPPRTHGVDNRLKTGEKQAVRKRFDPAIGTATRWRMGGPSPNPNGRPRKTILTEAFRDVLAEAFPGDKQGRSFAEVIARRVATEAANGDLRAVAELADRTERRVRFDRDPSSAEIGRVPLASENANEQLKELTERLRARIRARRSRMTPPDQTEGNEPE